MFAFEDIAWRYPGSCLVRDLALPCPLSVSACRLVGLVWVGALAWSWILRSGFIACGAPCIEPFWSFGFRRVFRGSGSLVPVHVRGMSRKSPRGVCCLRALYVRIGRWPGECRASLFVRFAADVSSLFGRLGREPASVHVEGGFLFRGRIVRFRGFRHRAFGFLVRPLLGG